MPENSRVYAIGDIHGRADLLRALHAMIAEDARGAGARRKVAIYLGDYIDRGADCRGVVDLLVHEPLPGFEAHHLLGNHDQWLLDFLDDVSVALGWLLNGGDATLASYGVDLGGLGATQASLEAARSALGANLPDEHRRFFEGLQLMHTEGDYLFVHAGIRPGLSLDRQDPHDLLWIRDEFLASTADHGMMVVHGHTPAREVQVCPNRIGVDTGAFATDRLTCLVLEGAERRFLQTAPADHIL